MTKAASKTNKAATRAVIRNLTKWHSNGSTTPGWQTGEAWEHMSAESAESFRADAIAYLGDRSELRTSTLESADWPAVFEHFHDTPETEPEPEQAPAVEQQHAPGALIGYGRVSTKDQEVQLQRDALNAAGCIRIFEEKASGKSVKGREALAAALDYARPGDTVTVWKLDRLGRSALDALTIANDLYERGIGLRILTGKLCGSYSPNGEGKFFFTIMAAFAELERDMIRERTIAGLEAAREQGRFGGRPASVTEDMITITLARKAKGESVPNIAKALGVSKSALYRALSAQDA